MIRVFLLALFVSLSTGCVRTSLDTGENHPANPNAAAPPSPETPPTLRPGFDPNVDVPGEKSAEAPDHQHHHHHHHDHGHAQHDHGSGPTDGGAG
jgi:hypothetical protein